MAARTVDLSQKVQKVPGPGHYDYYQTIRLSGKYSVSKYESSKASNFNP